MKEAYEVKGLRVYDPRTGEYVISDNPALTFLDLILRGLIKTDLDCDDLIRFTLNAADYCDEKGEEETMRGPCLCGDPYCPSCGDPEAARVEEECEKLWTEMDEKRMSLIELKLFKDVGFAAVEGHREACKDVVAEVRQDNAIHVSMLEDHIERLKEDL
jgi:hypothetical protein